MRQLTKPEQAVIDFYRSAGGRMTVSERCRDFPRDEVLGAAARQLRDEGFIAEHEGNEYLTEKIDQPFQDSIIGAFDDLAEDTSSVEDYKPVGSLKPPKKKSATLPKRPSGLEVCSGWTETRGWHESLTKFYLGAEGRAPWSIIAIAANIGMWSYRGHVHLFHSRKGSGGGRNLEGRLGTSPRETKKVIKKLIEDGWLTPSELDTPDGKRCFWLTCQR